MLQLTWDNLSWLDATIIWCFLRFVARRVPLHHSRLLHWRSVWYVADAQQIGCIFENKSHIFTRNYQYDSNQNIFGTFYRRDYILSFPRQFVTDHSCLPLIIVCDCGLACFTQYRDNAYLLLRGYICLPTLFSQRCSWKGRFFVLCCRHQNLFLNIY